MDPMIITVAINEGISKKVNPAVPVAPEEIAEVAIECARAGASIIHFHPRDQGTGENRLSDYEQYAEIYRLIQKESDVLLFPSYSPMVSKEERSDHVFKLIDDPTVNFDFVTWDVGLVNDGQYDPATKSFLNPDYVVFNSHADLIYFLSECQKRGVRSSLGARSPDHMRQIVGYAEMGLITAPVLVNVFFREGSPFFGLEPSARSIQMYLDLVPPEFPFHWSVVSKGSCHGPMNMLAAAMGGHLRTGLGDNPLIDGKPLTNVEHVERAVDLAVRAGREVSTPERTRSMLGISTTA